MSNAPLDRTSNADNSTHSQATRRDFLKTSAAAAAATTAPFWFATTENSAKAFQGPNNRHVLGCIGTGSRWEGDDGPRAMKFADCVAFLFLPSSISSIAMAGRRSSFCLAPAPCQHQQVRRAGLARHPWIACRRRDLAPLRVNRIS